jgi:hypothetical protein
MPTRVASRLRSNQKPLVLVESPYAGSARAHSLHPNLAIRSRSAAAVYLLMSGLEADLLKVQQEYETQSRYGPDTAPQM